MSCGPWRMAAYKLTHVKPSTAHRVRPARPRMIGGASARNGQATIGMAGIIRPPEKCIFLARWPLEVRFRWRRNSAKPRSSKCNFRGRRWRWRVVPLGEKSAPRGAEKPRSSSAASRSMKYQIKEVNPVSAATMSRNLHHGNVENSPIEPIMTII